MKGNEQEINTINMPFKEKTCLLIIVKSGPQSDIYMMEPLSVVPGISSIVYPHRVEALG